MSVVGIDFGTLHSKIGVARQRGIDILTNEVSNRATPSLVAFGPKQRAIGEAAKTQETFNIKNTIGSLKRLIGRSLNDQDVQHFEKNFINASLVDVNGSVGVQVLYTGEQQSFSATQLVAMYLGKLRDTAAVELKAGVCDVVIAVPGWYSDIQRRALLDAAQIAGLNPLRLINDSTAVALGYGITKSDLPEPENPRHILFVDMGHSSFQVSIIAFSKGQLVIKAAAYDRHLGGRDIDQALLRHFASEFQSKYKIDVLNNAKATFRLAAGCEKLKKVLSANIEAPLNIESIMNDLDVSSKLHRDDYEALIAGLLNKISAPLHQVLAESGLTVDQIDAIELVGGSTRIPAVRARIQSVFPDKVLSATLNQDEAIARGATFACAMLSPTFRVRDFHLSDITPYTIKLQWARIDSDPDDDTELVVFPKGNVIPSTKVLTFYRRDPFDVEAVYAEPGLLPGTINPWISRFTAKAVHDDTSAPSPSAADSVCVKIKTRLNLHGILSFAAAYVEQVVEEEKDEAMEVDSVPDGELKPAPPAKKRQVKKTNIPFVVGNSSMDPKDLEGLKEKEAEMHAADKLVTDTEDRKNALEEYVYDMRGKLDDRYALYVQAQEKEKLLVALQEAEDWLYTEEGEDALKSAYVERLTALKVLGDPIVTRYFEAENRTKAVTALRDTLNTFVAFATSTEERYAHIEEKDKQSVLEKCATVEKWLDDMVAKQAEKRKNEDVVLKESEIVKKRDEVVFFATPIKTRPKPKPPTLPTPSASAAGTPSGAGTQTPNRDTATPDPGAAKPQKTGESEKEKTSDHRPTAAAMDVD